MRLEDCFGLDDNDTNLFLTKPLESQSHQNIDESPSLYIQELLSETCGQNNIGLRTPANLPVFQKISNQPNLRRFDTEEYEDDFEEFDYDYSKNLQQQKPNSIFNSQQQQSQQLSQYQLQAQSNKADGYYLLMNDIESDDIEANQTSRGLGEGISSNSPDDLGRGVAPVDKIDHRVQEKNQNQEDIAISNMNFVHSSQSTVFASGIHHITSNQIDSPKQRNIQQIDQNFYSSINQPLTKNEQKLIHEEKKESQDRRNLISNINPFFSVDGFLLSEQRQMKLKEEQKQKDASDWISQSMNEIQSLQNIKQIEVASANDQQNNIRRKDQRQQSYSSLGSIFDSNRSRGQSEREVKNTNIQGTENNQNDIQSYFESNSDILVETQINLRPKYIKDQAQNQLFEIQQHDEQEEQKVKDPLQSLNSINLPLQYPLGDKIVSKLSDDQQELLLQRGRNSVLEEVEDDDIVNQNSSKSSSKENSQERQQLLENRLEMANHILQSFSQTSHDNQNWNLSNLQLINQRNLNNEEIKQEEPEQQIINTEVIQNQQITQISTLVNQVPSLKNLSKVDSESSQSSRRGRRSAKGSNQGTMKFAYFAASSLSDDRWICPICLDIFEDAVETPCCHNLFCEECIKKTPTCPLCNQRINGQLRPNIPIRRLVNELSIYCINQPCEDVIRKGEIDKHLKICPYTPLICPNNEICGKIIRKKIEKHKNEECPYRIVECLLKCGLMLPLNDMEDHIAQDCPKFQIKCKNSCQGLIERGEMDKHISIDCPLQIVECPNKVDSLFEESCQVRLKRREMESHKLTCNYRRVYCQNQKCGSVIIYKDLQSHDERCLFKIIECENTCRAKVQRQLLDKHKEICENQLVKCSYYDLGCKVEILRKYYYQHLQEEAFNHSIIFIEGQKKKNREIEELKYDLINLRQNYDVELQTMYLELHRMKDEMTIVKQKTGISTQQTQNSNNLSIMNSNGVGTKLVLGNNAGLAGLNSYKSRFDPSVSSAGSGQGILDQNRGNQRSQPFWFEANRQNNYNFSNERLSYQQHKLDRERFGASNSNNAYQNLPIQKWGNSAESNVVINSNAASLAQSAQSIDNLGFGFGNGMNANQSLSQNAPYRNNQKPPTYRPGWVDEGQNNYFQRSRLEQGPSRFNFVGQPTTNNQPALNENLHNESFSFFSNHQFNQNNHSDLNNNNNGGNSNRRIPISFYQSSNNFNNNGSQNSKFTFNNNNNNNGNSQNQSENDTYGNLVRYYTAQQQQQSNNSNSGMNQNIANNLNGDNDAENRKNQLAALFLGSMNGSLDSSSRPINNLGLNRNSNSIPHPDKSLSNQNASDLLHDQPNSVHQQLYQSYQNLYQSRQSIDNYDGGDQRMSFGGGVSGLGASDNNISNINKSNLNQNNNGLGGGVSSSQQSGIMGLSGNSLGAGIDPFAQDTMMRSAGPLGSTLSNNVNSTTNNANQKNQEAISAINHRSNNMRNVTVSSNNINNPISTSNQSTSNSRRLNLRNAGLAGNANSNINPQNQRDGLSGMNELNESQSRRSLANNALSSGSKNHQQNLNQNYSFQGANMPPNQDLDSSNVIYDDDFEIEEEKQNY